VEAYVLVVTRFVVEDEAPFVERARLALGTLAACPGYRDGRLSRALDDPRYWCLVTDWESVGAYRRALSGFDVKVHASPLLAESMDEPSAYEVLASAPPGGTVVTGVSDRAADPTGPLRSRS
jgi:heme oxygenase (mycobilin-producing)